MDNGKIEYIAELKPTGKAIKISAENDAEITYQVPGSEIANVVRHATLSGKALKITVEVCE